MKTKEEIQILENQELLELEHDTEVDLLNSTVGTDMSVSYYLELIDYHYLLKVEIENRGLTKLPRLNGFN